MPEATTAKRASVTQVSNRGQTSTKGLHFSNRSQTSTKGLHASNRGQTSTKGIHA